MLSNSGITCVIGRPWERGRWLFFQVLGGRGWDLRVGEVSDDVWQVRQRKRGSNRLIYIYIFFSFKPSNTALLSFERKDSITFAYLIWKGCLRSVSCELFLRGTVKTVAWNNMRIDAEACSRRHGNPQLWCLNLWQLDLWLEPHSALTGEAYIRLNKLTEAEHWYRESLRAKPDHIPAHLTYGKLLAMTVRLYPPSHPPSRVTVCF